MQTLRAHSHADRQQLLDELVPVIERHFGENLLALAVTGSFARGDDGPYSDLELTAFVKRMPPGRPWAGIGKIIRGLLVEVVWMTRGNYLERTKEITNDWYLAGSDVLVSLINKEFIDELNLFVPENVREKCISQAVSHWNEVQEATGKVLNAVEAVNRPGLPMLLSDAVRHMLIVLCLLNGRPFSTFSRIVEESRRFVLRLPQVDALTDLLADGRFTDLDVVRAAVAGAFSELESAMEKAKGPFSETAVVEFFD